MRHICSRILTVSLSFSIVAGSAALAADAKKVKCGMTFNLAGWSAFYKTAKGDGKITCDNGQSADVKIKVTGGGLTFGKSKTVDGKGNFTDIQDISELYGGYAAASAHAGAAKSAEAAALTKGEVSLSLAGTGGGVDIGIDFSKFTITKK